MAVVAHAAHSSCVAGHRDPLGASKRSPAHKQRLTMTTDRTTTRTTSGRKSLPTATQGGTPCCATASTTAINKTAMPLPPTCTTTRPPPCDQVNSKDQAMLVSQPWLSKAGHSAAAGQQPMAAWLPLKPTPNPLKPLTVPGPAAAADAPG